ncbi:MAG: TerB family tellurite resistance protein [Candidatus Omnitrophica bacterium]|nr:TerB family tellurite resistance protein [Candidatus Omnitrophota bacterium]
MAGFLDKFRKSIVSSVFKGGIDETDIQNVDDKIALGVLLWIVAEADDKFLSKEEDKIKGILIAKAKATEKDIAIVLESVKKAAQQRIDLYTFTHEVSNNLSYNKKMDILEDLFRVACIDKELDNNELELIRKISGLFRISHKDFINTKIKIKKEAGLETFGL